MRIRPTLVRCCIGLSVSSLIFACKTRNTSTAKSDSADSSTLNLDSEQRREIATKRTTCPFVGSAVSMGEVPVSQSATRPLGSISDVIRIGDSGGGDLGSRVLVVFTNGNHAFMKESEQSGRLDTRVPDGTFSLDFPGSVGSHPGHSGILEGDPTLIGGGRFDEEAFNRLLVYARNGVIKRSDFGRYIAQNLFRDPQSKVFSVRTVKLLGGDIVKFARQSGPALLERIKNSVNGTDENSEERGILIALTTLAGEDNLPGSAGEFALLFSFLANSPKTVEVDGEPALSVDDVTSMFRDKRFPDGWESWKKTSHDWVVSSLALTLSAAKHYLFLKTSGASPAIITENCSFQTSVQACVANQSGQSVAVDTGKISHECTTVVTKKLGTKSADSWNCRAACFDLTLESQRQNCPEE